MGLLGNVTVPTEDTKPRQWAQLPAGRYIGELINIGVAVNDTGTWEAIDIRPRVNTDIDGSEVFKRGDQEYVIAREVYGEKAKLGATLTTVLRNADGSSRTDDKAATALRITGETLATIARATGIAEITTDGEGVEVVVVPEFETTQDYADWLSAAIGNPIGITIKHETMMSTESGYTKPLLDDNGKPRTKSVVGGYFALEDVQ